jgi:predicted P-loop ATPase
MIPARPSSTTLPSLKGEVLVPGDYTTLERRWISREFADAALLRRVESLAGAEIVGRKMGNCAGIVIPYIWPGEDRVREYRLRRDHPDFEVIGAEHKQVGKYLSPPGRGNMLYFVPGTDPCLLSDVDLPAVITEGEFKSIALWRLAWHHLGDAAESPSFLPIGLSGVWNWRGTIGKTSDADGFRVDEKGPIPDLLRVVWKNRRVTILFDADGESNPKVHEARRRLTTELESRGAEVFWFVWPKNALPELKGIDDFLAARGPEEVLVLLSKAKLRTRRKRPAGSIVNIPDSAREWKSQVSWIQKRDGEPKALLANAIAAFRHAPEWSGVLGYDEFAMRTVAMKPVPWAAATPGNWTMADDLRATEWLQHTGVHVSLDIVGQAIEAVSKEHSFHPVRRYLDGLVWDGVSRLDTWVETYLGVNPSKYSSAVGTKWMISAMARVYQPGAKADCCLILEGPQGIKKSTALKAISDPWFTDEIADLGSKDAALQTRGVWLIEIAELDSLSRSEVGRVKAFMSRASDRFRPPYGKRVIESPRQCVFAGTVNHATYLRDETGGRRFWPVACGLIKVDELARDRDQLWVEARVRFQNGESWWLDTAELNEEASREQADRYEGDPWHEPILTWLQHPIERRDVPAGTSAFSSNQESVSIEDILSHCLGKRLDQWTQADKNRVGRCLRAAGWARYREWDALEQKCGPWKYRKVEPK